MDGHCIGRAPDITRIHGWGSGSFWFSNIIRIIPQTSNFITPDADELADIIPGQ